MSQASRSKVRARARWRRQVARFIVDLGCTNVDGRPLSADFAPPGEALTRDPEDEWRVTFDVHAVREAALELVALEEQQAVFEEWTRARGRGPDNREPGAFDSKWSCASERGEPLISCGVCEGRGAPIPRIEIDGCAGGCYFGQAKIPHRGGWPGKLVREWPGDSRAPMGRALARLGRRVLAAIEGQPSECQGCVRIDAPVVVRAADGGMIRAKPGERVVFATVPGVKVVGRDGQPREAQVGEALLAPCSDCQGTGHNLRGFLPSVEATPQMLRRLTEGEGNFYEDVMAGWLVDYARAADPGDRAVALELMGPVGVDARTRVAPRGEHRLCHETERRFSDLPLDARINIRGGVVTHACTNARARKDSPRWHLGELRRARAKRRAAR